MKLPLISSSQDVKHLAELSRMLLFQKSISSNFNRFIYICPRGDVCDKKKSKSVTGVKRVG